MRLPDKEQKQSSVSPVLAMRYGTLPDSHCLLVSRTANHNLRFLIPRRPIPASCKWRIIYTDSDTYISREESSTVHYGRATVVWLLHTHSGVAGSWWEGVWRLVSLTGRK